MTAANAHATLPSAAAPLFGPGLVHVPCTPFTASGAVDHDAHARLIDFHLAHGAQALALPMHAGESVSLTTPERHRLLERAIAHVAGRVPVIAHVSQPGSAMAASMAAHAQSAGAAAVVAHVPYYWTPPQSMLVEHFAQIAAAVTLPVLVANAPAEMNGVKVSADSAMALAQRAPNVAGLVDASLDWQFMIELLTLARRARPDFALFSGDEYLVSSFAIGARSAFAPLAIIAPRTVARLFAACAREDYAQARADQEALAALVQAVRPWGVPGLKAAARIMGRDLGEVRAPLTPVPAADRKRMAAAIRAIVPLRGEPQGW